MKIQCNVCESAEATVLCCADEAALCWTCDEKVHAANKLVSKHQRVLLSASNSQMPKCDICQETAGYFFCLEDRALLCRKCDVAIHTVNTLVSSHQRFLLTGVKVGQEAADCGASSTSRKSLPTKRSVPLCSTDQYSKALPVEGAEAAKFLPPKLPSAEGSSESMQQCQFDEFLGLTGPQWNYNHIDYVSSKADSAKLGDSDCSPILKAIEVELDEGLDQVLTSWAVPQIGHDQHQMLDAFAYVPDVCYTPMPDSYTSQQTTGSLKRRRQL